MARDFKLSNFLFTSVTGTVAGVLNHTSYTPTGDAANSGTVQNLFVAAAGTSTGQIYDTKQVMGYRNSKIDTSASLANYLAGNEISANANDPVLPGNTSYAEMYMTFNMNFVLNATAASNNLPNGGYFVVEGAYDNGFGAVDSSSYAPISNGVPLVLPSANLAAVAVTAGGAITTIAAHNLKPGDVVTMYVVTGFATTIPTAGRLLQVLSVPSPNQVILAVLSTPTSSTALLFGGTPTAGIALYRVNGGAFGGHRAAAQISPTRRNYFRLRLVQVTTETAGPTLNLSRVGLTMGRDNASIY
jgi:hypothetical protein